MLGSKSGAFEAATPAGASRGTWARATDLDILDKIAANENPFLPAQIVRNPPRETRPWIPAALGPKAFADVRGQVRNQGEL